jgi:hypothetical protein
MQRVHHIQMVLGEVGSRRGLRSMPQYLCRVGCMGKFKNCSPMSRSPIQEVFDMASTRLSAWVGQRQKKGVDPWPIPTKWMLLPSLSSPCLPLDLSPFLRNLRVGLGRVEGFASPACAML